MDIDSAAAWKKTACILCSVNCGLEVQTSAQSIVRIRGDKANPVSQGYLCEKSQRMDHYQNGADRIDSPMRRSICGGRSDREASPRSGRPSARTPGASVARKTRVRNRIVYMIP